MSVQKKCSCYAAPTSSRRSARSSLFGSSRAFTSSDIKIFKRSESCSLLAASQRSCQSRLGIVVPVGIVIMVSFRLGKTPRRVGAVEHGWLWPCRCKRHAMVARRSKPRLHSALAPRRFCPYGDPGPAGRVNLVYLLPNVPGRAPASSSSRYRIRRMYRRWPWKVQLSFWLIYANVVRTERRTRAMSKV
jgi:hypothetical protein